MNLILLYALLAAVTYLSRRAFLRLPDHWLSPRVKNGLTFIPVGIFAGLIFPALFIQNDQIIIQPMLIGASIVCLLLMAWSKNILLSFGVSLGLVVLSSLGLIPWQ